MKKTALTLALLAFATSTEALADTIRMRSGREVTGVEVEEETYEKVVYKIAGSRQEEKAENVLSVQYDREPAPYRSGREAMEQGRFVEAAARFKDAASARNTAWVAQYGLFYGAECLRLAGQPAEASDLYQELLKDHPKTRFYPDAKLGLGTTLAAQGRYDDARRAFQDLASEAKSKGFGERWELTASLETAKTHERENDPQKAASIYRNLARNKFKFPDIGYAATLGEIRTTGKGDNALRDIEQLIDDEKTPPQVRAGAYNVLGHLLDEKGEAKRALLAYLRVCLDPPLQGFPEERAEALYFAAAAFEKAKTQDWQDRAEALRRELKESYPTSPFAQR